MESLRDPASRRPSIAGTLLQFARTPRGAWLSRNPPLNARAETKTKRGAFRATFGFTGAAPSEAKPCLKTAQV